MSALPEDLKYVIVRFCDISGRVRMFTIAKELYDQLITEGIDVDGSSVAMTGIEESDIVVKGDPDTLRLTSLNGGKAVIVTAEVVDPAGIDPRIRLKENLEELKRRLGMDFRVGAEVEFFLLKDGRPYDSAGYFHAFDDMLELRIKFAEELRKLGLQPEVMHHEVAPGQNEINFRYDSAVRTADNILTYKTAIKKVAADLGLRATFMPKPFEGMNGSGMHLHLSLFKDGENMFFSGENGKLSELALNFLAGVLTHAKALAFFASPTVNSYRRLVPGFEAPVYIAWGHRNRSALVRVPVANGSSSHRIEYRAPDPSSNPYLLLSAVLAAGLDGIEKKLDPGEPYEGNLYHARDSVDMLPGSLEEAMNYALKDEVLIKAVGEKIFERYVEIKKKEILESRLHVSDWERSFYLDV